MDLSSRDLPANDSCQCNGSDNIFQLSLQLVHIAYIAYHVSRHIVGYLLIFRHDVFDYGRCGTEILSRNQGKWYS